MQYKCAVNMLSVTKPRLNYETFPKDDKDYRTKISSLFVCIPMGRQHMQYALVPASSTF